MSEAGELLSCSFCAKSQIAVARLIAGPGVFICDECVALCYGILAEHEADEETRTLQVRGLEDMSTTDLLKSLEGASAVSRSIDRHFKATVVELRHRGLSWSEVGEAVGTSRQAAWERFADDE